MFCYDNKFPNCEKVAIKSFTVVFGIMRMEYCWSGLGSERLNAVLVGF